MKFKHMPLSEKNKAAFLLCVCVLFTFLLNFYHKTIFARPSSIHQWRQTDCLSITKNYYEEGMHFFEPKIHFQGDELMQGKAVSECPILNYTVAAMWKVFGEHEFIYRLLEYLIFLSALFVLLHTVFLFSKSSLLSFFSVSFILTSPLLTYYSLNFLADVPALSFSIICFCFIYQFYHHKNASYFYLALLFGTLAVLLKASALIPISLLYFFTLIDVFGLNKFFGTEQLFKKKTAPIVFIATSILLLMLWYSYAITYNNNEQNSVFLLTVLPIWSLEEQQLIYNLKMLFNNLFPLFLNKPMLFLFFTLVVFVISGFKKLSAFLKYSFVFSGLFFILYLCFFFQVFNVHDYYLINLMIFPVITLFCFCFLMAQTTFLTNNMGFTKLFIILLFIFNAFQAASIYRLRMIEDDKLSAWYPFVSEDERNLAKYLFWDYSRDIKKIENFKPILRAHHIKREDKVLCIPDQSFDISLYFLDQKGYTISRNACMNDTTVLEQYLRHKIDYIVLSDTTLKTVTTFKRMAHRFDSYMKQGGVEVFKIKN